MKAWNEVAFKEILEDGVISYGIVQPGPHTNINSVPVLRVNNISKNGIDTSNILLVSEEIENNYARTRLVGGELLITVVGNVGLCVSVPEKLKGWNVARAIAVANIKDTFDSNFIKYQFYSPDIKYQIYGHINDTVQPTLNLSSLKEIKFYAPPLPEQRAISSVLSSFDDKIDLLHRQNVTLEAMAQALFRQWFVVEAKEEWEDGKVEDLFVLQRGYDLPNHKRHNGNIPIISSSGINDYHDSAMENGPGVVIGRSGILGNVFFIESDFWPLNTTLFIKEYKNSSPLFSYFLLKSINLSILNAGSAVPTLNRNHVHILHTKLPPLSLILKFENIIKNYFKKIRLNSLQIRTLERLRDSLLPKLMSGEVRVRY